MDAGWISWLLGLLYIGAIISFVVVVIMTRRPVGVSLAWLVLIFALPFAGFVLYLMFGSPRLGSRRLKRIRALYPDYSQWHRHLCNVVIDKDSDIYSEKAGSGLFQLADKNFGVPLLHSNRLQLFHESETIFNGLLKDINEAKTSIELEFYIWEPQGRAGELAEAIIRASRRGVDCQIVLDDVGSRSFLRGAWARKLRLQGVGITPLMPVGPLGPLVERIDIRNHRKILVVDDNIAWTGSFNLVDPALFRQDAEVGQWVDAMVRIEGVAAHVLGAIVYWDKAIEVGKEYPSFTREYQPPSCFSNDGSGADIHVLSSGPEVHKSDMELLHQMLLAAIYESREELLITSPYFVPDEALLTALKSAAMRGVDVQILVPEKNDSRMVHYASRSYYQELLQAGVKILQFNGGLLHTKCVLVDRNTVLFGTVNLDMRSVWLNYELTLIIYDAEFGQRISVLLEGYIAQANPVDLEQWERRPLRRKLLENTMQLFSPLL